MKSSNSESDSNIITLNVGGQIFQTSKQTLISSPPNSLLYKLSSNSNSNSNSNVPFIDRDPKLFSTILSFLRTGQINCNFETLDFKTLIDESKFYGIDSLLMKSINNPFQFNPFDIERSNLLPLNGRDYVSAISSSLYGSVHVAHGSKITSFDWSLTRKNTVLTRFVGVDCLLSLSCDLVAAGANDFDGLLLVDVNNGVVEKSLVWENSTRSSSTVQGIGSNGDNLFVSFESGRRNSNTIVVYDVVDGFRPVLEIARNEIYGAEFDCLSIPATKLSWVSSCNLLMASGSHSGPNGVMGCIKLWDVRSGESVLEVKENVDCFADVDVSSSLSAMFKVGVNSGEVFFMDLRNLRYDNQWVCLGNGTKLVNAKKEGLGCKVQCYGNNVFVSKGGIVELWSEVEVCSPIKGENGMNERVLKKNIMGRRKDLGEKKITNMCFGGSKMLVTRKDQQDIEVWKSLDKGR